MLGLDLPQIKIDMTVTVSNNSILIIGISVRTTNQNNQAKEDIGNLWGRFMAEEIHDKIPNMTGQSIYAIYTDYEGDHTQPYTTILGYPVSTLAEIPEGMVGHEIEPADYEKFTAKGNLKGEAVIKTWHEIWNSDLDRAFTSDYEVYDERAMDPSNGEADIFVALN